MSSTAPTIVAIVPCYNEELSIGKVVADLSAAVPEMTIYVYDNNSTDKTAAVAQAAGAIVRTESRRGKGEVVRRAFADLDADIYVMIDGDDTYGVAALPEMIAALQAGPLDHVLGVRRGDAYRKGHEEGNRLFNRLVSWLFGEQVTDMLSGFRVFSRRFVKSFPALSREFEIETELTIHSMNLRVPQVEVPVAFGERTDGSESKLRTYRDGFRILSLIGRLLQHERPLFFHGVISAILAAIALVFGIPIIAEYFRTGLVGRFPTAFLSASLMIVAILMLTIGMVLSGVRRARREAMRLNYLTWSAPTFASAPAERSASAPAEGSFEDDLLGSPSTPDDDASEFVTSA